MSLDLQWLKVSMRHGSWYHASKSCRPTWLTLGFTPVALMRASRWTWVQLLTPMAGWWNLLVNEASQSMQRLRNDWFCHWPRTFPVSWSLIIALQVSAKVVLRSTDVWSFTIGFKTNISRDPSALRTGSKARGQLSNNPRGQELAQHFSILPVITHWIKN